MTISQDQADRLLKLLTEANRVFNGWLPERAREVRDIYAELAEQYAAAGYDLPPKKAKKEKS